MKIYIDYPDANIIKYKEFCIPKHPSNKDYVLFLQEVKDGVAKLEPYKYTPTWEDIRAERDLLLKECDWATLPDATPKPNKEAWLNYRDALKNIPQTFATPDSVVWPQKPI